MLEPDRNRSRPQPGDAVAGRGWIRRILLQDIRRIAVSWLLAILALVLAVVYAIPGLGFASTLPSGRRSVVATLDPAWSFLFGVLGVALMASLVFFRAARMACHLLGFAVSFFWSLALLVGALISTPVGPITSAVLAVTVTILHLWSVVAYATE